MLATKEYNRGRAFTYAKRWAFSRNPLFTDYTGLGGNCTNFASQCALAASLQMNFTPTFGWYYKSDTDRAPAWTGVPFFYNFMTTNGAEGPFGRAATAEELEVGDFVQLGRSEEEYYHTLVVVGREGEDLLVAAQSDDAFMRPLSTYNFAVARFIHIQGVRVPLPSDDAAFAALLSGEGLPLPSEPVAP
ncbi:MAG: amidase domain-containing protein [Clostridia bacterium]|nr:amidase domain-containing protein [Clostridia bacterium]